MDAEPKLTKAELADEKLFSPGLLTSGKMWAAFALIMLILMQFCIWSVKHESSFSPQKGKIVKPATK